MTLNETVLGELWRVVGSVLWDKPGIISVMRRAIGASPEVEDNSIVEVMQ